MSGRPSLIERSAAKRRFQDTERVKSPALAARTVPSRSLLQKRYQDLVRQHLGDLEETVFAELTGLHFHIVWTPLEPVSDPQPLPTGCSVCSRLANSTPLSHCATCGPKHLELTRRTGRLGHSFTCELGVRNYWFLISVRGLVVGIAFVQALDKANHILRHHVRRQPLAASARVRDARFLGRSEFDHAAHLLRLIVQNAETATLSVLREADLTRIRQAMAALQHEQDRLHRHINHLLPADRQLSTTCHPTPQPPVVQCLLDHVHQHYAQPLTLRQCARAVGRNASYLSDRFAHAVGLPFKAYLTELRLEKSKELLGKTDHSVKSVSQAVGYASPNQFRRAFKLLTGLSPRAWRATLRPMP